MVEPVSSDIKVFAVVSQLSMKNAADFKHHCSVCYLITEEKKRTRRTRDIKLSVALALGVKFNLLRTPTVLKIISKGRECRQKR